MPYVPDTTPVGDNAIPNPSLEVDSWGWYNGGTRDTARGYAGAASRLFSFTAAPSGTVQYCVIGGAAADAPLMTPGVPYQVTFRWFTDNPVGITVRCAGTNYWNASYANVPGGSTEGNPGDDGQLFAGLPWPGGSDWALYKRSDQKAGLIAPAGTVYAQVYLSIQTTATYTGNVWIDAVRLAPTAQGDLSDYIDGTQPNCIWTGTPHRSPSKRNTVAVQGPTGDGGELSVDVHYYLSDKNNAIGNEITGVITGGKLDIDIDRAIQGTCTLTSTDATAVQTGTWVAIFMSTTTEAGVTQTAQRGLYRLSQPKNTGTEASSTVEVSGSDVTCLIQSYKFQDTYNIPLGTNVQTAIVNLLALCGITRHAIPATTRTTGKIRSYKPGDPITDALTSLTQAMGWYSIFATADGRATTREYRGLTKTAPARIYTLGQRSQLIGPIVTERSLASFANVIIAVRDNPQLGLLKSVARNDDPRSPASTTYPGGLGIVAEKITVTDDVDQAALDRTAAQELAQRGTLASATLQTLPDLSLDVHDVVQLNADAIAYPHLQQANGAWYAQQLQQGLTAATAAMTLKLRRSEVL